MRRPLAPVRNTYRGVTDAGAWCDDCPWTAQGRNALGLGNQHARRTGHTVLCDETWTVTYNKKDGILAGDGRNRAGY